MIRDFRQLDHEPANPSPAPLPRNRHSRALLQAILSQGQPKEADDPEVQHRQAYNEAASLQINRALELVRRIKSKRTVDDEKIIRTTEWLPVPDTPDDRTHTEARLRQVEKIAGRGILGIPRKRRVSEIRVEARYVDDDSQKATPPFCAYFMKPRNNNMPPLIDHMDRDFEANKSFNRTLPDTDEWEALDNILRAFEATLPAR